VTEKQSSSPGRGRETGDGGKGDEAELVVGFESEDGKFTSEDMSPEEWDRQTEKTVGILLAAKVERCGTEDLTDGERALWKELAERIGAKVKADGIESLDPMERATWDRVLDDAAGEARGDEVISPGQAGPAESKRAKTGAPEHKDGRCEECGRAVGKHLHLFYSQNHERPVRLCPTCCALAGADYAVSPGDEDLRDADGPLAVGWIRDDDRCRELAYLYPVLRRVTALLGEWCGSHYTLRDSDVRYDEIADDLTALHGQLLENPVYMRDLAIIRKRQEAKVRKAKEWVEKATKELVRVKAEHKKWARKEKTSWPYQEEMLDSARRELASAREDLAALDEAEAKDKGESVDEDGAGDEAKAVTAATD